VELLCHRTANEDVPENTLESLELAALLGCNVVELDVRRTLDGELVLNHDGILERLTDGIGETETTYYDDLRLRDAGVWMGDRFTGIRIARFEDALRLARKYDIRLVVHMKTKGMGAEVLERLQREGMLERVQFIGEWADVKQLDPDATDVGDGTTWVQPGITAEQVKAYHREGKAVVVNFSGSEYAMDVDSMKAAVAAGADGINVDYPRLGADAVGRPVERKLDALAIQANAGESIARSKAILDLSKYRGFPLQSEFAHWLLDADENVSRAAAIALVTARPRTSTTVFAEALRSDHADARANAAWALGHLDAPASMLLPLLADNDPQVLREALVALAHTQGEVSAQALLPLLAHRDSLVRGTAALALARHQPDVAVTAVPAQLRLELQQLTRLDGDFLRRGKPQLKPEEIDEIRGYIQCEMKMVEAISMLKGAETIDALEELALRPNVQFAEMSPLISGFQLWDRIGVDARPAVQALGSNDASIADRAEWMLIQGGPAVLPDVRKALGSENEIVRRRSIRVVAWQGDTESLGILRMMQKTNGTEATLAAWAIEKIDSLHPKL
jgi:glycerophosphoryl diester phosphodiesterase/HEAT repeat protein